MAQGNVKWHDNLWRRCNIREGVSGKLKLEEVVVGTLELLRLMETKPTWLG